MFSPFLKKNNELSEHVTKRMTTIIIDVVQDGIASVNHKTSAKPKTAMTRCCTTVSSGNPKTEAGTNHKKKNTMRAKIILTIFLTLIESLIVVV